MDAISEPAEPARFPSETVVYRQSAWTRMTHWIWAISLFFLLFSGLQIFNAHPTLYIGDQSGFGFDNEVLAMRRRKHARRSARLHRHFWRTFDTTGVFGMSGSVARPVATRLSRLGDHPLVPGPCHRPGRPFLLRLAAFRYAVVWLLAASSTAISRDLAPASPTLADFRATWRIISRLRFHHSRDTTRCRSSPMPACSSCSFR